MKIKKPKQSYYEDLEVIRQARNHAGAFIHRITGIIAGYKLAIQHYNAGCRKPAEVLKRIEDYEKTLRGFVNRGENTGVYCLRNEDYF